MANDISSLWELFHDRMWLIIISSFWSGYSTLFVLRNDFLTSELGYIDKISVSIGPGLIITLMTFAGIMFLQKVWSGELNKDRAAEKTFEIIVSYGSVIITFKLLGVL